MDDVTLALALHVLAVIHWIGGLAFVTVIVLPLAGLRPMQVRLSIPLVGATGLWMTYRMDLWQRFADPHFWWMSSR